MTAMQPRSKTAPSANQNRAVNSAPNAGMIPPAAVKIPTIAHTPPRIPRIEANIPMMTPLLVYLLVKPHQTRLTLF